MILGHGEAVLLIHRRLFSDDEPRFFVGAVEAYDDGVARVSGFTWLRNPHSGGWARKPDRRSKVVSLMSGTLLVYVLATTSPIEDLDLVVAGQDRLELRDGAGFVMDLSERVAA